jgi:uncharacterized protein (TIGR02246 family)
VTISVEIETLLHDWARALNGGDVERLMELCTADYTVIAAGAPEFSGRDVMRKVFAHVLADTKVSQTFVIRDVRVDGSLAVVATDESATLQPRDGGAPKQLELRQMSMLVREADGWKFARTLSNMLSPEETA